MKEEAKNDLSLLINGELSFHAVKVCGACHQGILVCR